MNTPSRDSPPESAEPDSKLVGRMPSESKGSTADIFTFYKQEENRFTNALLSLLRLSLCDGPEFMASFLRDVLPLVPAGGVNCCRVLKGIDGTADAELSGERCCIRIETKIASGALREEQIQRHLSRLCNRYEPVTRLVLLTPDDGRSNYTQRFVSIDRDRILHLEWRKVYAYLANFLDTHPTGIFAELVRQFRDLIRQRVFKQDIAGIIAKISFGERSQVYADKYLNEMRAGLWTRWNTPRQYKNLDGTGRKLLLYDNQQMAITVEVEIAKVSETNSEKDYPWTNEFSPGTLLIYREPISLKRIRSVAGLESFGRGQSPYQNVTQQQYRQLTGTSEPCCRAE